jgi:hypothetical protein
MLLNVTKIWFGLHFVRFVHKHIWSPWSGGGRVKKYETAADMAAGRHSALTLAVRLP